MSSDVTFHVSEIRKRKSAVDGSPKAKLLKKDTKRAPVVKSPKKKTSAKKSAALKRKAMTRTRSQKSSIAGLSGGPGSSKPDFTDMINLITLQTFDGSWDLSRNLATIFRKSIDDLTNPIPEQNLVSQKLIYLFVPCKRNCFVIILIDEITLKM